MTYGDGNIKAVQLYATCPPFPNYVPKEAQNVFLSPRLWVTIGIFENHFCSCSKSEIVETLL